MPYPRHSNYKGYYITTRSTERSPLPAPDAGRPRFDAFFRVDPADPSEESWQQFPAGEFATPSDAAANALGAAQRSIDLDISAGERRRLTDKLEALKHHVVLLRRPR